MNRTMTTLALLAALALPARAGLTDSFKTWFEHLKEGLTESSVSAERQTGSMTAVAAVRGDKQSFAELDKPAWKSSGRIKKARELKKQKAELSSAVDLVLQGKMDDGDAKLAAFETAHPDSPYLAEAHQARAKIKQARQP